MCPLLCDCFFFFNDTATTEIYTLSLHDALPILRQVAQGLRTERERLARLISLEMGKPIVQSRAEVEIGRAHV